MVEIPEHLLKRSKERRAALGLGGGEATPEGGASESAAPAAAAAPAAPAPAPKAPPPMPKAPEPPKPDPLYIQAAKTRPRLPWWSIPVFAALPLWGWVFVNTLSVADAEVDPFAGGAEIYSSCASCHGADGMSVATAPFDELQENFPDFRDQMMWVREGTSNWGGETYGELAKALGAGGTMPAHQELTDMELAQVVLHERTTFAGVEIPDDPEAAEQIGEDANGEPITDAHLLQIASGELTWAEIGVGPLSAEAGYDEATLEAVETGGGGDDGGH